MMTQFAHVEVVCGKKYVFKKNIDKYFGCCFLCCIRNVWLRLVVRVVSGAEKRR